MANHRAGRTPLVFWYASVDPFMVDRFNALARAGLIGFEVWFSSVLEPEREWEVNSSTFEFRHRFLPPITLGGRRTGDPRQAFREAMPEILVSFHGLPLTALSLLQHLRRDARLIYYVEKTFDSWVQRTKMKEGAKYAIMRLADGFLSPGPDADGYIRKYAGYGARIYRLNHALNVSHFAEAATLRRSTKNFQEREALGLRGMVFLNVGRMIDEKGIPTLLDAYASLRESRDDVSLLLVGNGRDRSSYERWAKNNMDAQLVFHAFVQQESLPDIYALGDVFVFPTLGDPYGIVVDEARASALPVISTTSAGEITSRIRQEIDGLLVPPRDPHALCHAMDRLASVPNEAAAMGRRGAKAVAVQTTYHWVEQITAMVDDLHRLRERRNRRC